MSGKFIPFFINSNISLSQTDILTFENFMTATAGNIGNSYITYSLLKELNCKINKEHHIQNIYKYNFSNEQKDIDKINNECTHVFLILQDQIRVQESYKNKLPYKDIINFLNKINKPVIIAGLGANSLDGYIPDFHKKLSQDLINFLRQLSNISNCIGIRGNYTAEILENIGIHNYKIIGCPSFFESGNNRIIKKENNIKIDEIVLTSIFNSKELIYNHQVCQDYSEEKIIKAIAFNDYSQSFDKLEKYKLLNKKYHIFANITQWKNFVKDYKFAIGYRLHGTILALNSGVPAICCNSDSRAREMCEFLKIPLNTKIKKNDKILNIYKELDLTELNASYPVLYDNFAKFILENTGIKIHQNNTMNAENQEKIELKLYKKEIEISKIERFIIKYKFLSKFL